MALITIDGEISIPRSFTLEELRQIPRQILEQSLLLGGRAIAGVRLSALVEALRIKEWARFGVVRSGDGYVSNIPVAAIDDCVLVYAVDGRPLPVELGGPVRLLARGLGRCANVKNVTGVSLAVAAVANERACHHQRARLEGGRAAGARGQA